MIIESVLLWFCSIGDGQAHCLVSFAPESAECRLHLPERRLTIKKKKLARVITYTPYLSEPDLRSAIVAAWPCDLLPTKRQGSIYVS